MKKLQLILWLVFLSSCSFRSPNSEFYVMNTVDSPAVSDRAINVAVAKVKVPDMLDRAQMIVYDAKGTKVQILEFNRWAEVLPDILQSTVTNDLMIYLPNAYVQRTFFDNNTVGYSVNTEINKLEAYKGDKVILSAWWNIKNAAGTVLKKGQSSYEIQVEGSNIQDLADAQSRAVHLLAKDIAEALVKL